MSEKDIALLSYSETPIQEIHDPRFINAGVTVLIKREDLNHPFVSGNKWWKLKYNLYEAKRTGKGTLVTFGGAFSNHIYSTAAAAHELGFKSIGIIRGEETRPLNSTIRFALEKGMIIRYVSREDYRRKTDKEFLDNLLRGSNDFYLIPEGGTNDQAIKGCEELAEKLSAIEFDHLVLPAGTGGTIAGIVRGMPMRNIIGVSVLKGEFLKDEISMLIAGSGNTFPASDNWTVLTQYHHGGYASATPELLDFIEEMKLKHDLPLDHVYTGKLLWAIVKEVEKGSFQRGSTILALHTGGLQGSRAIV